MPQYKLSSQFIFSNLRMLNNVSYVLQHIDCMIGSPLHTFSPTHDNIKCFRMAVKMEGASPPVFEQIFRNARFAQGGNALFEGKVAGSPRPQVRNTDKL